MKERANQISNSKFREQEFLDRGPVMRSGNRRRLTPRNSTVQYQNPSTTLLRLLEMLISGKKKKKKGRADHPVIKYVAGNFCTLRQKHEKLERQRFKE